MLPLLNIPPALEKALQALGHDLRQKSLNLATAESCTGGLLGATFTSIAGSSAWFVGSIVAYDNSVKMSQLDVSENLLELYGAVSGACVMQMAKGVCQRLQTSIGISISGIAGPDGGTKEKPVGTVWIGFSVQGVESARLFHFKGNREEVRKQAIVRAIQGIIERLQDISNH